MIKLYKWNEEKSEWIFFDYGVLNQVESYNLQGFVVVYK